MKTKTLERILSFAELPYAVQRQLHCSGQRTVYLGTNTDTNDTIVVKVCNYAEIRVARIQREIKILQSFDTPYFPKVEKQAYITKETLHYFFDSFDPRGDDKDLVAELQAEGLRPFFLTVEEYIEHQAWSDIQDALRQEPALVAFMVHVFEALRMLWKVKIGRNWGQPLRMEFVGYAGKIIPTGMPAAMKTPFPRVSRRAPEGSPSILPRQSQAA